MAISASEFDTRFPEFAGRPDSLLADVLAEAGRSAASGSYHTEARRNDAIALYAAHLLAISPFGREMRLQNADGTTLYSKRLDRLQRIAAMGLR